MHYQWKQYPHGTVVPTKTPWLTCRGSMHIGQLLITTLLLASSYSSLGLGFWFVFCSFNYGMLCFTKRLDIEVKIDEEEAIDI